MVLFYIFYLFVEVLAELVYSSTEFIDHPHIQCFELFIWEIACLVSFSFFEEVLFLFFIWDIFWLSIYLFPLIRQNSNLSVSWSDPV